MSKTAQYRGKRRYNVEVGVAYGVPGGRWDTTIVEVVAHESDGEGLESEALWTARRELEKAGADVGGLWIHNLNLDEAEEIHE